MEDKKPFCPLAGKTAEQIQQMIDSRTDGGGGVVFCGFGNEKECQISRSGRCNLTIPNVTVVHGN